MASSPHQTTRERRGDAPHYARNLTLWAAAGTLSIVGFLLTLVLGIRLYAFASDSMSPTIPQGSLGLTVTTPAARVSPGDVVTVQRVGTLPVTHRALTAEPASNGAVLLTLRGDANSTADSTVYEVGRVGLLIGHVPLVGYVAGALMTQPWVVAVASALTAGLIIRFWWPSGGRHGSRRS